MHLVKIACERPDKLGRSLSHWDCAELARQLVADEVVEAISPQTVQRILASHKLKPWRKHLWLSPQVPRDAAFVERVKNVCTLYTRKLAAQERVLCVDEKTSLQPRPRRWPTLPAQSGQPVRVEHAYGRNGALNLFAAFDTRTGKVYAHTAERKRQAEFLEFLEQLDREIPAQITKVHLVLDNLRMHTGKQSASLAGPTSPVQISPSPGALLVDESGGAMVQHPATQTLGHRRLCGQSRLGRETARVCP